MRVSNHHKKNIKKELSYMMTMENNIGRTIIEIPQMLRGGGGDNRLFMGNCFLRRDTEGDKSRGAGNFFSISRHVPKVLR